MNLLSCMIFRFGLSILNENLEAIFLSQNLFIFISINKVMVKLPLFITIFGVLALVGWFVSLVYISLSRVGNFFKLSCGMDHLLHQHPWILLINAFIWPQRFLICFNWYQSRKILTLVSIRPHIKCWIGWLSSLFYHLLDWMPFTLFSFISLQRAPSSFHSLSF